MMNIQKTYTNKQIARRQKVALFLGYTVVVAICALANPVWGGAALILAPFHRVLGLAFLLSGIALFFSAKWCAVVFGVVVVLAWPLKALMNRNPNRQPKAKVKVKMLHGEGQSLGGQINAIQSGVDNVNNIVPFD